MNKNDVLKAEAEGASLGWVAPLTVDIYWKSTG